MPYISYSPEEGPIPGRTTEWCHGRLAAIREENDSNVQDLWNNDRVQFARLLSEIVATQEKIDIEALAQAMDLDHEEINELFERAYKTWEHSKQTIRD